LITIHTGYQWVVYVTCIGILTSRIYLSYVKVTDMINY
jgi:hypothetical protein